MIKDWFPDAKYVFRGLIPTEIKLPKFISECLLNLHFWKCRDRHLQRSQIAQTKNRLVLISGAHQKA